MHEIERMADSEAATGHYALEDLVGTSVADRNYFYSLLLPRKGMWAKFMRVILGFRNEFSGV